MKTIARWTALVALFTIPFLPLYVSSELFFPFITGKGFAFRILVEVAFVAYIILAILDARYRPRFSWLFVLFTGLIGWMAIADTLGVLPGKAFWSNFERMDGWVMLIHLLALFIATSGILGVDRLWRRWWFVFVSVAAAVCMHSLVQLGGGAEIQQGGVRLTATFGNAIYLAVYLMFSIFAAAWLSVRASGWTRIALFAFIALAAIILFFTGSRGPLVGLGAGAISGAVLWLFLSRREWKTRKAALGLKIVAGGLVGLAILITGLFMVRTEAFVLENPFLSRAASLFSAGHELMVRSTLWGIALEGVKEDPITGWGQEGFNQIFNKYYIPSLYQQEPWFDRAHNMYIDWLVAGGVPALLLFLGILALGMYALFSAPELTRAERVLLVSALIAYAVQALVVFDNLFSYVPLVILLAMAHSAHARTIVVLNNAPEIRGDVPEGTLLAIGSVVAVMLIWTVNVPGIRAAHYLVYGVSPAPNLQQNMQSFDQALKDTSFAGQEIREQLVSFAARVASEPTIPNGLKITFAARAAEEIAKEVELSPNDARLRMQYATALETVGNDVGALAQIDAAITLSPKKQTLHLSRGFKLYELNRFKEAQEAFDYAYKLDTSFDDVALIAASGHIVSGNIAGGKALLIEAVGTTTPDNDRLFYSYYQTKQWNELIGVAKARILNMNDAEANYRLARAYAAASRFYEARKQILDTIAAFPESRAEGEALMAQVFPKTR